MADFKLIEVKYIDMFHFQLYEGKFQDMEELSGSGKEIYIYANISNLETKNFHSSEVRIYAHSFEDVYDASHYELENFDDKIKEHFRHDILRYIETKFKNNKVFNIHFSTYLTYDMKIEAKTEGEAIKIAEERFENVKYEDMIFGGSKIKDVWEIK